MMITELFLPTKGGTAVSFDDDFRRLGGKEVHIITAEVPGAKEFDRDHPNSIYRLTFKRRPWIKPESLFIYSKLLINSFWLAITRRVVAVFAGRALPEGLVALIVGRLTGRLVLILCVGDFNERNYQRPVNVKSRGQSLYQLLAGVEKSLAVILRHQAKTRRRN